MNATSIIVALLYYVLCCINDEQVEFGLARHFQFENDYDILFALYQSPDQ